MSWNVQGEIGISDERLHRQLEFLDTHTMDIDLFLFQAVNYGANPNSDSNGQLGTLLEYFSDRDYHVVHTGDWARELAESTVQPHAAIEGAHNRCTLTASRWPIKRRPLTLRNHGDRKPRQLNYYYSHFPEKLLVADVDVSSTSALATNTIETWNVGIINGANWGEEKLNMLNTVYGRVYLQTTKTETPVLLGGDFNAPKRETENGTIITHGTGKGQYTTYPYYGDPHYLRKSPDSMQELRFDQAWQLAEARLFDPDVSEWGMRDAYWAAESSQRESSTVDYTHVVPSGTPSKKRLDHVFVSSQFLVRRCELWNGEGTSVDGLGASDHAPVVAELELE